MGDPYTASMNPYPIVHAAMGGDASLVASQIQSGTDVNQVDGRGSTALHWALERGHDDVVEILIESGADVNKANKDGWTPLDYALMYEGKGSRSGVGYISADKERRVAIISALIERGAAVGRSERIPLHWAAGRGYMPAVIAVLKNADAVHRADDKGATALHWAAGKGHAAVITALAEAGGDVNRVDAEGDSPIHWIARDRDGIWAGDRTIAVSALVDAGADVNKKDNEGFTPLDLASHYNDSTIMMALIKAGADVNWDDINRHQLLHQAAENKQADIVLALVKAGADVYLQNDDDQTAADVAEQQRGRKDVIAIFLRKVEKRQAQAEIQEADEMLRQLD